MRAFRKKLPAKQQILEIIQSFTLKFWKLIDLNFKSEYEI